jgi:hypothetical protein
MLWLMIGLLVSLGALLLAVGAAARHILIRRAEFRSRAQEYTDQTLDSVVKSEKINPKPEVGKGR